MSYAIRKDGKGWRSIGDVSDVGADEDYSATQPQLVAPDPKDAIRVQIKAMEAQELSSSLRVKPSYRDLRASEYPPITDFLDAYVKDDKKALKTYKDACLEIKNKYPKE